MKKQYVLTVLATFLLFVSFIANAQPLPTTDSGSVEKVLTYEDLVGGVKFEPIKVETAPEKAIVKKAETDDDSLFNRAVQFFGTSAIDLTIVLVILSLSLLGIFIFWFVGRRRKIKARRTETIKTVSGVSEEKALVAVPAIQQPSAKASAKTAAKEEKKVGWFMWFFGKIFHAIEHYFTHGISLFFIINDELNKLELETDLEKRYKKARKLCKEYIISLAVTSIILIVLVFGPSWIGIVSKLTEFIPIYVSFEGEELNLAVVVCYVLTALLILFWVITLCFGWRSPSPGHKTWVRINGHFAFPKKASSAGILTFPIGKLISLWKCPTLIEVGCILSEESDPFITTHIMTASGKTAVFDNGTRGDEEKKRFAEDILYKNHLMMSRADFLAIVEAEEDEENGKKFFNKYGDGVERFQEDLKFICASAREEVCGMKSGAQITGSLGNVKSKIAAVIKRELDKLDCGYKVAIFLMAGLDFSCEVEREGDNSGLIKRGIESLDIPVSAAAPATTS